MAKRNKVGIGLDVGSRSVQLAVLRSKKGGICLEKVASCDLPHEAVIEGQVMDSQAVCERIAGLLKNQHLKGKEAAISVGGRRVLIKKITTDEMSDEELKSTIAYEAKGALPFDISEVSLDYAPMPQDGENGRMDVLLVAAKNEMVFDATETLRWAGGRPALLEAEPFALQAALTEAGYVDEQSVVAALHIGFQSTEVSLFVHGQFDLNRSLTVGGKNYVESLIRELGIPFERATTLLARSDRTEEESECLDRIARQMSDKLAEQVEKAFPEYFGAGADRPATRIVLCGGGAHLPVLESALRQRLGVEVEIVNPFRNFVLPAKTEPGSLEMIAPNYTAAVGLALRAMGDVHPGFNLLFPTDRPGYKRTTYAGLSTVLPILGVSAILFVVVMLHLSQETKLSALHDRLKQIGKETDLYRDKIAVVEELNRKRADVAARVDVISQLDRDRFTRVRVMELLNGTLPELTWLDDVQDATTARGPGINIIGLTSSNLKVSQFMTNLLQSPMVRGVDLLVSEQTEVAGTPVTRFTLQATIPELTSYQPPADKPENQIKKGTQAIREKRAAEAKRQLQRETGKK
jgi:type IV pilus assembly protein PilM